MSSGTDDFRDPDLPRRFSLDDILGETPPPSEVVHENYSSQFSFLYDFNCLAIVIYIYGACPGSGKPWARGGCGVYFGSNSAWNITVVVPSTRTIAELRSGQN